MENTMKLENAISDMKRQLRAEPKSNLIRTWIGLYAQVVQQAKEIQILKEKLNLNAEASATVTEGNKSE